MTYAIAENRKIKPTGNRYCFTQTKSQTNVYQSIKILFTRHLARQEKTKKDGFVVKDRNI